MESVKQQMDRHIGEIKNDSLRLKAELEYLHELSKGKSKIFVDSEKLEQLFVKSDELFRTVERLERANTILYENRGKASLKKAASSKINGAKGGRPPKEISAAKKRIDELEEKWVFGKLSDEEKQELEHLYHLVYEWENKRKPK